MYKHDFAVRLIRN